MASLHSSLPSFTRVRLLSGETNPPCMQPERVGRKANFVTCKKNVVELPRPHVRFGSEADMCGAKRNVRFTPNSDRESGHVQCKRRCRLRANSGYQSIN